MKIWIEIEDTKLEAVKAVLGQAEEKPKKAEKAPKTEEAPKKEEGAEETGGDYENMKSADLYALCCERGISSRCKKRDKASLIAVLKENDENILNAGAEEEKPKKAEKTQKEPEPVQEEEDDDWNDEEEEEPADPYAGKTAKELFNMCKERGISVKPRQKPEVYAKALKEADAAGDAEEEDEDDDWEV